MRVFQKTHNGVSNQHAIYESVEEAVKYLKQQNYTKQELFEPYFEGSLLKQPFPHWTDLGLERDKEGKLIDEGKFCLTDDGWITPVLKIYDLKRGAYDTYKNGKPSSSVCIKTPFGVYNYARLASGKKGIYCKMQVSMIRHSSVSLESKSRPAGKSMTNKKMMFCYLVYATGNPVYAYKKAVLRNYHVATVVMTDKLIKLSFGLLKEEDVQTEINRYLKMANDEDRFKEDMRKEFEVLGLSGKDVARSIAKGLKANENNPARTGSMSHGLFIEKFARALEFVNSKSDTSLTGKDTQTKMLEDDKKKIGQVEPPKENKIAPPRADILDKLNQKAPEFMKNAEFIDIVEDDKEKNKEGE